MHKAKACIITCIDFRFHNKIRKFLKLNGYTGKMDLISVAGASHDLVHPLSQAESIYLWNQIAISIKLHSPDEIVIIDHQDCGMYKASGLIKDGMNLEEDKKVHQDLLINLNKELRKRFPQSNVKLNLWYAKLDGSIDPLFGPSGEKDDENIGLNLGLISEDNAATRP